MRYAIIESGGKQYRAVEGDVLEVDRLPQEAGKEVLLDRVYLMADGDNFQVGTPTLSGIEIRATVVDHVRGPKLDHFQYSPKKRIRIHTGHRQQYTRLRIDFIGGKGEARPPKQDQTAGHPESPTAIAKPDTGKAPAKKAATKKAAGSKPASKKSTK